MNKLANAATHVLVFQDKSKKFLSKPAYQAIYNAMIAGKEMFPAGNQIINLKSVKILQSLEDYYEQYPQERPQRLPLYPEEKAQGFERIINRSPIRGLESMIRGLQQFLDKEKPLEGSPSRLLMGKMLKRKQTYEEEALAKEKVSNLP